MITKVLIANRGEIAVRIIRAAKDCGYGSVAVYAEPDSTAKFVKLADEAIALGGSTARDSYLLIDKIIEAAERSGADAVHPGYGFLSENADFARAVLDAGLIWIGPSPQAIADLGDKVTARRIAHRAGAPMAAGTTDPVTSSAAVVDFAMQHGVPVAIKAAFGGGGRGMKIARTIDEIPEMYESATREASAAFGRSEVFVEQYLDKARHVEAQVLADTHGNIVVVGTRDCTLQRRFQKLVEEAPAPFLTSDQRDRIFASAKAICREVGYHGVGTVEYLVQGDTVSFLEVNTRLQVEHPVTEETSGIDLVHQQFRIANGETLDISEDLPPRGHSFEFRINAEDAGRGFLPTPGSITAFDIPTGPGVRIDSGVAAGDVVGGQFDSLLAKLVVTGATRAEALARAARALEEFQIDGLATVLPFHRAIVRDPAFVGDDTSFGVHTRWIENEWVNTIEPFEVDVSKETADETPDHGGGIGPVTVEVGGFRVEVSMSDRRNVAAPGSVSATPAVTVPVPGANPSTNAVIAPMQGSVVDVAVSSGQSVVEGDLIAVLEAMKMENPVLAHKSGVVTRIHAEIGAVAHRGAVLAEIN
jgi:acetyl-CoA/propionyl-CoA carboxylase biotin carboxyl carrier protein